MPMDRFNLSVKGDKQVTTHISDHKDFISFLHDLTGTVNDVVAVLTIVLPALTYLFVFALNKFKNINKYKQHSLLNYLTNNPCSDEEIEDLLLRMLVSSGASRAAISLYGGGKKHGFFSKDPCVDFEYFTMVWEASNIGVAPSKPFYIKIPIVSLKELIEACLVTPDDFVIFHESDTALSKDLRYDMLTNNNQTIITRLIGDSEKGFIGAIAIQFTSEIKVSNTTLELLRDLFLIINTKIERRIKTSFNHSLQVV